MKHVTPCVIRSKSIWQMVKFRFKCCYCPFSAHHVIDGGWDESGWDASPRHTGAHPQADAPRQARFVGQRNRTFPARGGDGLLITPPSSWGLRRGDARTQMRRTGRASLWVNILLHKCAHFHCVFLHQGVDSSVSSIICARRCSL